MRFGTPCNCCTPCPLCGVKLAKLPKQAIGEQSFAVCFGCHEYVAANPDQTYRMLTMPESVLIRSAQRPN